MLQITPFSSGCVKADSYADYIPFVSTISNLVDIFLKHVFQPCYGESNLQNNHFFAYLETKSLLRSITLLIPVLGNALIAGIDLYSAIQAEELEGLAAHLNQPHEAGNAARLYSKASFYGSIEAQYQLGQRLLTGTRGITVVDKPMAIRFLRAAAALGHIEANNLLSQHA